jgi:L-ascorbate metabolism protein UlaG (beta-lactamase superfamily)
MKVKWLGHSCFLITADKGTKLITDPYEVGGGINYSPISESADIVTVSHEHGDHNNVSAVQGKPQIIKGSGTKSAKGIEFNGIATYHDKSQGKERGANTVFCFIIDGIKLCHLGDLGHLLSQEQITSIGNVDIVFIPVGGLFTIDASEATHVCEQLLPKVIIPMHFKTPKCAYPINGVDSFLKGKERIKILDKSEIEFQKENLPANTEIIALKPAL